MRTPAKWLATLAALCFSTWLGAAVLTAQERDPPGDRPKVEPRGERDAESGPPRDPRKPGPPKPRMDDRRDGDRPGEPRPRRPAFDGDDQLPPGRPGDMPPPDFAGKPPFPGRKPPLDGPGRKPGMQPGMPGMPFGPPMDPETEELNRKEMEQERECAELASRLWRASKDERETLKKQLVEAVNKHFDVRQQRRELQLKRLEEELKRLREANQKRLDSREQLVTRRVAELLGQHEDTGF